MESQLFNSLVTILTGITGLALVAILVSKNANTSQVITSGFSGYSQALNTALSPVTGASTSFATSGL
jgi:uncharacterized membrane protein YbjE (DUF340 family)